MKKQYTSTEALSLAAAQPEVRFFMDRLGVEARVSKFGVCEIMDADGRWAGASSKS